jgi:hydroxyacylglutathione hydrolase
VDGATLEASGASGAVTILDVRSLAEWREGHLPWAHHIPLGALPDRLEEISRDRPVVVHCQAGGRAAIGASLLVAHGFPEVRLFPGGFAEWKASRRPIAEDR